MKSICKIKTNVLKVQACWWWNAPRPMKEKNGAFYISAGGADKKILEVLNCITLTIGAAKGGSDQQYTFQLSLGYIIIL
ncbi:MAG: hypothetical protein CM15mV22_0890 [Eurybiavirus sp.]|nr:MAG: hypothetical protein CM15mV22_0890 [Eurybiavirus sp.]